MRSAQAQVEQLLEEHVPLPYIQAYIDGRRDISEGDRDALWLYAWAKSRKAQRRPRSVDRGTGPLLTAA